MRKFTYLNYLSAYAVFVALISPSGANAQPKDDESSIGQKIGREASRVVGQIEGEGKKLEHGWKEKREQDKAQQEQDKQASEARRKENK